MGLDPKQELFDLGVFNDLGLFFSTYPTSGSFPRTASNHLSTKSIVKIISELALLFSHKKGGIIILKHDFDFSRVIVS